MATIETIQIASTRDVPGIGAACHLRWGSIDTYAPVSDVRDTAEDLFTCAAYADLMGKMLRMQIAGEVITALMTGLATGRDRPFFGHPTTVTLQPAGSSRQRTGVVLVKRGSMKGWLSPEEARGMGRKRRRGVSRPRCRSSAASGVNDERSALAQFLMAAPFLRGGR
ncbi:hypothetical protein [Actinomadura miaoliensis]|uniref:GNAT family N-acetyltransferase n=1 Tax=Actinomadura miaoliensis TaxID=430685 RepID=A0ABP7W7Q8_9ACTN